MDPNQQSADDLDDASPRRVTRQDLNSTELEAPIADVSSIDCALLLSHYQRAGEAANSIGDEASARVYGLLTGLCTFHFKPDEPGEPFGPMLQMNGRRSMIPSDLSPEEADALSEIVATITHPALRARIADTLWLNKRSRAECARIAVEAYAACTNHVLRSGLDNKIDDQYGEPIAALHCLIRSLQIARATIKGDASPESLATTVSSFYKAAHSVRTLHLYRELSLVGLKYGLLAAAAVASDSEAMSRMIESQNSIDERRSLLKLAGRAYSSVGADEDARRCRLEAAELLIMKGSSAGSALISASLLMEAIDEMRNIRGTRDRRKEVERLLVTAQAEVSDEMGSYSQPVDLSDVAELTLREFKNQRLSECLRNLAQLSRSPSVEQLRRDALETLKHAPLASMFDATMVDAEGKTIAVAPGFSGTGEPSDEWIRHKIAQSESLRRGIVVRGQFEPIRQFLARHIGMSQRHFESISMASPFVPSGHEELFSLGFARLLQGDYASSTFLLIPQIENSVRHVLRLSGRSTSIVQSDLTQEDRSLSAILGDARSDMEQVFGTDITFEIDMLFNDRFGPALRHTIAHGKLSASDCFSSDCIYANWLIYRLACIPLFPHWSEAVEAHSSVLTTLGDE